MLEHLQSLRKAVFMSGLFLFCALLIPVGVVEGDEFVLSNHVDMAVHSQIALSEGYRYFTGPLLYWVNYAVASIFDLPSLAIFQSLSFFSYLCGLLIAFHLQKTLFQIRAWQFIIAVLLCQELVTTAFYPNDFAMLLPWLMAAFYFRIAQSTADQIKSVICFTIAMLFRIDTVLCLPLLLLIKDGSLPGINTRSISKFFRSLIQRKVWEANLWPAAFYLLLPILILSLAGMSLFHPLEFYKTHLQYVEEYRNYKDTGFRDSWLTIFDLTMIALLSIVILSQKKSRKPKMLAIALLAWIPYLLVYGWNTHTPKYYVVALLMTIPLLAHALSYIRVHFREQKLWPIFIVLLLGMFWPLSYKFLGLPNYLMTHDGPRYFAGSSYAIKNVGLRKRERQRFFGRVEAKILKALRESQSHRKTTACLTYQRHWIAHAQLHQLLLKLGYTPENRASIWRLPADGNSQKLPITIRVIESAPDRWNPALIHGTNCKRFKGDW